MQIQVVIGPTGEVGLYSKEGSFEGGKQLLEKLLGELAAGGVQFAEVGDVEQHRHEDEKATQTERAQN